LVDKPVTTRIQVSAKFPHVRGAALAEFKKVAAEVLDITKDEPGVLQYDWFFSADETVCVVRETYRDADALLAHASTVGEELGRLADIGGGCELEVFGEPPARFLEATAGLQLSVFPAFLQGK
jgi:quinol monooxygenase YgiN